MQWSGTSCFDFIGKFIETGTTWSEWPNERKAIVEQILMSEERNLIKQGCQSHSQGSK